MSDSTVVPMTPRASLQSVDAKLRKAIAVCDRDGITIKAIVNPLAKAHEAVLAAIKALKPAKKSKAAKAKAAKARKVAKEDAAAEETTEGEAEAA